MEPSVSSSRFNAKMEDYNMNFITKFIKRWKVLIAVILIAALGTTGFFVYRSQAAQSSSKTVQQRTQAVTRGTLSISLSGSGSITPAKRKELSSSVNGTVLSSNMEEGQNVKEGDILLTLNSSDAELSLKKLENTLKQKESSVQSLNEQISSLNTTAPIAGIVTALSVKVGDSVNKGTVLMTLVDQSRLSATLTFENASLADFKNLKTVQVHVPSFMSTLEGAVESVSGTESGVELEISVVNPGALTSGTTVLGEAQTSLGSYSSTETQLEWITEEQVKAEATGTIQSVYVQKNQSVTAGKLLVAIENDDLPVSLENALIELENAQGEVENAKSALDGYVVKAPYDGVLVSVTTLLEGDSVKSGTTLATLINENTMETSISIDELDIGQVEVGQTVIVTAEALEDTLTNPIEGSVSQIAAEGSSSNGVTSYPVTITMPGRTGLKSGMNVDVTIQVMNKENVILVPIEALQKSGNGYIAWVKQDSSSTASGSSGQNSQDSVEGQGNFPGGENTSGGAMGFNGGGGRPENTSGGAMGFNGEGGRPENTSGGAMGFNGEGGRPENTGGGAVGISGEGGRTQNTGGNSAGSGSSSSQGRSGTTGTDYYAGAVAVEVTVGANNETYMEVLSGLSEGDLVVLPQLSESTSSGSTTNTMGGGMTGGMSGGMGGGVTGGFTGGGGQGGGGGFTGGGGGAPGGR